MKTISQFKKDKKGIFGLNAIQQFFVVILGIALLAYVIVVIMGTLNTSTILTTPTGTATEATTSINITTVAKATVAGFANPTLTAVNNATVNFVLANFSMSAAGVITNTTAYTCTGACNVSYTYNYYSTAQLNTNNLLTNTSTGVTGFFSSINPVYAILAVLVIILVLVVLVRVVSGGNTGGRESVNL